MLDYGIGYRTRSLTSNDGQSSPGKKKRKTSIKAKKEEVIKEIQQAVNKHSQEQNTDPFQSNQVTSLAPSGDKTTLESAQVATVTNLAPTGDKDILDPASNEAGWEDRLVGRIRDEVQAWTIPQALERERYLADSWMKLTKSLVGNLKLVFNNQFNFTNKEDVQANLKMLSAGEFDPSNLTIEQFWAHPASAPLWKFSRIIQTDSRNNCWAKWWATKVNGNWKQSPRVKLDHYLQAMDYFNSMADQFWAQMAFNPTYKTQEGIVADLTRLGDYIRLAAVDTPVQEEYYKTATEIAKMTPKVETILFKLRNLWPSALNPLTLHYGRSRFGRVILDQCEDTVNVKMTATMTKYRFNPR